MKSKWASWVVCVAAAAAGLRRSAKRPQFELRCVADKTVEKFIQKNPGIFQFKPVERRAQKLF